MAVIEVTDDEIRALRSEAATAGDLCQVALCDRALGVLIRNSEIGDARAIGAALDFSRRDARVMCASVIEDARATREGR